VQLIDTADPAAEERFIHLKEGIDVLIPRGSPEFIRRVCGSASVATIETGIGCCHVFVERSARLDMAADIAFNAKVQRPGVTNSLDTLLVDAPVASQFLPLIGPRLAAFGVEIRGCERTREALPQARPATPADHGVAFLSLVLAVRVVDGLDIAIAHINQYGGHNSEAIVTQDYFAARRFCERVDAGAVYVNASTRFTDGYEFGLGSELGISTQKLHRRGPLGLRSLTTWKWVIYGDGQVRD
jgi:glutamate-5-semialdehyde dehydrogenase